MIGRILKNYTILEKIKDGSVGAIFKARNSQGQEVAIKQISATNALDRTKLKAFKKEATVTRKLIHPYIIKVFEYVEDVTPPFFSMEYFPSENLKYWISHEPEFLNKHEFLVLRCVAEALMHAHGQGVVHADIKPENVLMSKNCGVRLIDFSLAQTSWDRFNLFQRKMKGTPPYMSPEHITKATLDERSDVYAFGILVFETLAKRPPFTGPTPEAIFEAHLHAPIPILTHYVKTASSQLDTFVEKCMQKNPKDRFQNMAAVMYEMSRWERQDTTIRLRQVKTP